MFIYLCIYIQNGRPRLNVALPKPRSIPLRSCESSQSESFFWRRLVDPVTERSAEYRAMV